MTDIVERLRGVTLFQSYDYNLALNNEAADEIERLRAEIERNAQNCIDNMNKMHTQEKRLRAALEAAQEAMMERRAYCDAWEWKYREHWDEEDAKVDKAIKESNPETKSRHIIKIQRTSVACPSQWDLFADDGTYYYARYRYGRFSIAEEPLGDPIVSWQGENNMDGSMSDDEMKKIISLMFTFAD